MARVAPDALLEGVVLRLQAICANGNARSAARSVAVRRATAINSSRVSPENRHTSLSHVVSSVVGGRDAAASSTTTWLLIPPKPKALTAARRPCAAAP